MDGCHVKPEQFFNLILGYHDRILQRVTVAGTGGVDRVDSASPAAGEAWVITAAGLYHNDPTARLAVIGCQDGALSASLDIDPALAAYVGLSVPGCCILKAGDTVYGQVNNLAVGRTGYLSVNGYKMLLTQ